MASLSALVESIWRDEGLTSGGGRDESGAGPGLDPFREMEHASKSSAIWLISSRSRRPDENELLPRTSPPCSGPTSNASPPPCIITTATWKKANHY